MGAAGGGRCFVVLTIIMDVDIQHESPPKALGPHESLWFPDGNVVLATDSFLFKVHKSFLSSYSSVFRDMFELPNVDGSIAGQSESGAGIVSEMLEGLPLVILAGDKGEDVVHLLRAIYERRCVLSHSCRRQYFLSNLFTSKATATVIMTISS